MNSKHVVSATFIRVYVYCQGAYVIEGGRTVFLLMCNSLASGLWEQHNTVVPCSQILHRNIVLQRYDERHAYRVVSVVGHGHDLIT